MIVLVTNKVDLAADRVVDELARRATSFVRLNTEDFPSAIHCRYRLGADGLRAELDLGRGRSIVPDEVRAVWYRRPEPPTIDPGVTDPVARRFAASESTAVLRGFLALANRATWVNDPAANRVAEHKVVQLRLAAEEGFAVPETLVTNVPREAADFCERFEGRVVAKGAGPGFVHPVSRAQIYTNRVRAEHLAFLGDLRHSPVVLQEYVDKALELRVTVVGERVFAAEIDSQSTPTTTDDWRRDAFSAPHRLHRLPDTVAERCRRLARRFGLVFGALDLILTPPGDYVFLELNPNGEWDWIEAMTGTPIAAALADVLTS
ncbi:MAG: MvdC family ATP-grasp ribosomal peptide maturase [Saccharothrix sp.]|nr:MvdC family ATP-grasp ribosomal peptide maturase [Saccharothrix sp.]